MSVRVVELHELGSPQPGFVREAGASTEGATLIRARAEGGATSGWHHHGERDVFGYVMHGQARFEFGSGHVEVEAGSSFHVPAGLVHRDVNPLDEPHEIVLVLVGSGPLVVEADAPSP